MHKIKWLSMRNIRWLNKRCINIIKYGRWSLGEIEGFIQIFWLVIWIKARCTQIRKGVGSSSIQKEKTGIYVDKFRY